MRKLIYIIPMIIGMISCTDKEAVPQEWQHEKTIQLDGVNPIGLTTDGTDVYISDGDHNRIVKIDKDGAILSEILDLERPMHIDYGSVDMKVTSNPGSKSTTKTALYVPEYGRDSIAVIRGSKMDYLRLFHPLDAPAGVSVYEDEIAIADFYTNRILYYDGTQWISFGAKGKALGQFYYPTDVQITSDKIYVADAYNNRGQVFDKTGKALAEFGAEEEFNAATGIFVSDEEIFLTDFENDRIVVFGMDYQKRQVLDVAIHKPTDVIVKDNQLMITNYRNGELVVYQLKDKELQ